MNTYQAERLSESWTEVEPLLRNHWREIAHYQDISLDPDKEAYAMLENAGALRCYSMRDEAGALVGYVAFFVRMNMHYRSSLQAVQDVLYVDPAHRRTMAGIRLIKFAECSLAAEGVQVVYHHVKCTNRVGELLERLGYELIDRVYGKRLN